MTRKGDAMDNGPLAVLATHTIYRGKPERRRDVSDVYIPDGDSAGGKQHFDF